MCIIVHRLNGPRVTRKVRVICLAGFPAKKTHRHMLHGIQPEPVALRGVQRPRHRAAEIRGNILGDRLAMTIKWPPARATPPNAKQRAIGVLVQIRPARKPHKHRLGNGVADIRPEIPVERARFLGQIAQAQQRLVFHILHIAIIAHRRPVLVPARDRLQMEILRNQAGIIIRGCARSRVSRHRAGPVIHHIVKINADAKPVGHLHHLNQLRLGAIPGGHGALLVRAAQIEGIEHIVTRGVSPAVALGRVGQPQTVIPSLGNFRDFLRHLGPGLLE